MNLKDIKRWPLVEKIFTGDPIVAVIRFSGVIADSSNKRGGVSYHKFTKPIDKAFGIKNVDAVVLVINSPGGAPAQCSLIGAHMRRLADEKKVPVYAFVEDVAASGGYWLACIADEIYVQESSIVGSIGVVSAGFGFEEFIKKHGVKRRVHTAGKSKSFLDPFLPVDESDVKRLKSMQLEIHKSFKGWIKSRRGEKLKGTDATLFEGQFWAGDTAVEKGLVDGVQDVHGFLFDKFGKDVKKVECSPSEKGLLSLLPFGSKLSLMQSNLVEQALDTIEARGEWGRYGL